MSTSRRTNSTGKAGRPLPESIDQIRSDRLNDDAKLLIVRLLGLVTGRFGSVTAMVREAMVSPDRDKLCWAHQPSGIGEAAQVRKMISRVSKVLGSSATQVVDWPTVDWLVRISVRDDMDREQLLPAFAGLWCAAKHRERPPGYTGPISHDHSVRPRLTDPDDAPDASTRAELYRERWTAAQSRVQELEERIANLTRERDIAQEKLSTLIDERTEETSESDRLREENWTLRARLSQVELTLTQQRMTSTNIAGQLDRLQTLTWWLSHQLAVLVAHVVAGLGQRRVVPEAVLLPIPGLKLDPVLRSLLDVELEPAAGRITRWLAVYLRSLLTGVPNRVLASDPRVVEELNDVVAARRLPSIEMLHKLFGEDEHVFGFASKLWSAAMDESGSQLTVAELLIRELATAPPRVTRRYKESEAVSDGPRPR